MRTCSQTQPTVPANRHQPRQVPLRVLVGKERFSENHAWSEMPRYWPAGLDGRAVIEVVGQGQLEARLANGGPPVDVVVPMWSPLPGRAIRAGSFGLIQQFGVGVDNVDLDAAADVGVWVANMPGLNAVPVAEHAVALLLALARRLPEAKKGFEPGRWGEPAGRSLAGTAACIIGAGAVGTQVARRLAAFDVTVTGTRRQPSALPRRRATGHPPAHRGDRPHRRPHQRLLRGREPTTRRRPRQLPRSPATGRATQISAARV